MSFHRAVLVFSCVVVLFSFGGCSGKKAPTTALFNGECGIAVDSRTKGASIYIDGIKAGTDQVLLQVPCGEKRVEVVKKGFIPYHAYFPLAKDRPLKIQVSLNKSSHLEIESLSEALVAKVRGPILSAAEKAMLGKSNSTTTDSAPVSTPDASVQSDNVDDWR